MKKFLMIAAMAVVFAAPAFAEDKAPEAAPAAPAMEAAAPAAEAAPAVDVAKAKEACTSETNEKVKLPENAGAAEKAQWDAAFAECLKGKGVAEEPAADATKPADEKAPADAAAPSAAE